MSLPINQSGGWPEDSVPELQGQAPTRAPPPTASRKAPILANVVAKNPRKTLGKHAPASLTAPGGSRRPLVQGGMPSVPGYEILAEIGRGNMGLVYRARQLSLDRLVALKMIHLGASASADALERFADEARLVASLCHPNIVQIYEINLDQNLPYFSMELVSGGNLAEYLGGSPQPCRHAAQIVETLARAIHVAHQHGIVHRDLKPANILLAPTESQSHHLGALSGNVGSLDAALRQWTLKITDFGLAKQLDDGASRTESGMIMGTPSYMAPEQAEGKSRDVGPTTDVYALGAILYELLTGRPPYAAESPIETVLQLFQMEPVPPSSLQPKVPRDLETICLKCLQKEQVRRYASAEELAQDLQHFLADEPIKARPISVAERARKWAKRRPAMATLAASASLAVLGLLGLVLWHQADLQSALSQAQLDERVARADEEGANQRERLGAQEGKVKELLQAGDAALAREDWQNARVQLLRARDQAADEPELSDLRAQVDRLLEQVERRQHDRVRLQKFQQRRSDALFTATLYAGGDLPSTLEEARTAALSALDLFGVTPTSQGTVVVDDLNYTEPEKTEIKTGCSELLLILAESVAQPLPGQPVAEQQRKAREALVILDRATALGQSSKAFHLRRAQYWTQADDVTAAHHERELAAALPASSEFDKFLLGTELHKQGNWKEAINAFESVLQTQPDHFWGNYYLALCWFKSGRFDLAAARLTSCLGWRPGLPWLLLLRGSAWTQMNRLTRADEDFAAALKNPLPDAARYGLYINRGVLRIHQDRPAEAIEELRRAIALRPGQYRAYVNLAQAYVKNQNLEEAVRQLDQAVQLEPHLAALYRTRAQVHLLRKAEKPALADLDRAIFHENPASSVILADDHLERGRLLHRRHDFAAAIQAYDAALMQQPMHIRVHRVRAEALLELNRLPEALQSLDICMQQGRPDADTFKARAAVRTRLGQYPGAQTDYTRALELEPNAATRAARGWVYLVAEAPSLALRDFEEVIRLDPSLGDAYGGRGYARAMLGQQRPAVADAEEALRRGPSSARLLYSAARIYAQAASNLAADPRRDTRKTTWLLSSWQDRAIELVQQTLDMQPHSESARFWHAYIQHDAALKSVRQTPGFRQLADRYSRATG